jgi:peroxiredoxin
MLEPGAALPTFTLQNPKREAVTDDAFRGAPAVLAFFPMAFTGG